VRSEADGRPRWILLAATLALVGFAWGGLLALPLSGEDWVLLARLRVGEPGSPHVFRPLSDAWLAALHAVFGPDARALHAGSLVLHLLNTALLMLVALELLGSRAAACAVALVFGLGAGVLDALAWVAAVNRPLAGTGALVALLGLALFGRSARAGLALLVAGLFLGLGANEEFYGTALLAIVWLSVLAARRRDVRRAACVAAAAAVVLVASHYFVLNRIALRPGRLRTAPGELVEGIAARAEEIGAGLSLPAWTALALPAAAFLILLAARRWRVALVGAGSWLAALVPFVLSEPAPYRAYPSQAPTALLVGAALAALFLARLERASLRVAAGLGIAAALFGASEPARRERLARWQAALAEIRIVERDAAAFARESDAPPVLVNLEASSSGPFCYAFGVLDPTALRMRGFLDAASAWEEPGDRPAGVWYGRRFEASYGRIEPDLYFAGRPRVEGLRAYERALAVGSLAEAERALRDPAVDLTSRAVVEATSAELAAVLGSAEPSSESAGSPATIEILAPFEFGANWARMTVRVRAERALLLVYQEHWLFEFLSRLSADQALRTDQDDVRRVELEARERPAGERAPVFRANAFGFAVPLAPGEHELELAWKVRGDG
jgi:hypothetical protein